MRFLLDHDVPDEVAQSLRIWDHQAHRLRDELPVIAPDAEVFAHAQRRGFTIVSCNRAHFLGLAREALQEGAAFPGLVVLIRRRTRHSECARRLALLRRAGEQGVTGNINFA